VGTQDGLFRFDSKNTRQFNKGGSENNQVGGSDIRAMTGSGDQLWVTATQGGLDKLSTTSVSRISHIPQTRFHLGNYTITCLQGAGNVLFAGTEKGLYTVDTALQIRKLNFNESWADAYVDKLAYYKHFLLVFFRNRGCLSYDLKSGMIADSSLVTQKLSNHRFYAIADYGEGGWLLGTSSGMIQVRVDQNGRTSLVDMPFGYAKESIHNDVYAVCVDQQRKVWFSTENSLFKVDPTAGKYFLIDQANTSSLNPLNNIFKLYCDQQDNIWMGCQTGLFYLRNTPAPVVSFYQSANSTARIAHAYYLYPANDSITYVTAENGLYKVNINTSDITELDVTQVYDFIFTDPYGRLLVSNKTGLKELRDQALIPIEKLYPEFEPFSTFTINSALRINNAEIAMGTENNRGVLIWNFALHTVDNITTSSKDLQLDNNIINGLYKISEDRFCVITESSLIYIDNKKQTARRIHLFKNTDEEYGLFFDMCRANDAYYLSSYGNGVLVLDTNFTIRRIISTANGLSNNSVYKLMPWKDSLLFMTTNFGLNILNVKTGNIRQLFKSDGLQDNVFEETSGYMYNNTVYMGGINGFTILYPENLDTNPYPPSLYFDKVSVSITDSIIDNLALTATYFSIPANAFQTNVFFSGINFINPERTTYYYKIAELHQDWIPLGNRNFIPLVGLSWGTYHLQIKAYNEDAIQSAVKEITLFFMPEWYQTWWFKVLLAFALAGVLYLFYLLRINQIRKEQQIRSKLASDLHDDLGSTMNSVKIYTSLALMGKEPGEFLLKIKESTQEAIINIREMIWVLDDSKDSLEHLCARVSQFAAPLCEANNIQYRMDISDAAREHRIGSEEKRNLYLLQKEAVNNAIKYADAGKIEIYVLTKKGKPEIWIADDGKGFDRKDVGGGYGLDNMESRAKAIKYHIAIVSTPGSGTSICLSKI
jgi:ligand-binding sensor domain-containing protein